MSRMSRFEPVPFKRTRRGRSEVKVCELDKQRRRSVLSLNFIGRNLIMLQPMIVVIICLKVRWINGFALTVKATFTRNFEFTITRNWKLAACRS